MWATRGLLKAFSLEGYHCGFLQVIFSFILCVYFRLACILVESGKAKSVLRLEGSCLGVDSIGQNMSSHLNEETKHVFTIVLTVNGYEKCVLC